MKKLILPIIIIVVAIAASAKMFVCQTSAGKVLRHVVCLKLNEPGESAKVKEVLRDFVALQDQIESIQQLEGGMNVSQEGHDKGFMYCFILTFKDEAGLNAYLPHEDHLALVEKIGPLVEDVFVIDFWTGSLDLEN